MRPHVYSFNDMFPVQTDDLTKPYAFTKYGQSTHLTKEIVDTLDNDKRYMVLAPDDANIWVLYITIVGERPNRRMNTIWGGDAESFLRKLDEKNILLPLNSHIITAIGPACDKTHTDWFEYGQKQPAYVMRTRRNVHKRGFLHLVNRHKRCPRKVYPDPNERGLVRAAYNHMRACIVVILRRYTCPDIARYITSMLYR